MARSKYAACPARKDRIRIACHAGIDPRTVDRHFAGERRTLPILARAIHDSARALGIEIVGSP
jgi:hypothetical protein